MYDRLTKKDIEKMEKEIEHRKLVVRKEALEDVKEARAHGDQLARVFATYIPKSPTPNTTNSFRFIVFLLSNRNPLFRVRFYIHKALGVKKQGKRNRTDSSNIHCYYNN